MEVPVKVIDAVAPAVADCVAEPPLHPQLESPRVQAPVKDIPPDEFLTPEANTARLVEKHLSRFDRFFLNRFTLPLFGKSKESRAHEAEAIESAAVQLNTIVDLLETEGSEPRDAEEQKKLKDLYYDTYVSRPK